MCHSQTYILLICFKSFLYILMFNNFTVLNRRFYSNNEHLFMRYPITILLTLFIFLQVKAQINSQFTHLPPVLHCVKNETSNQLSIQWSASPDAGSCFSQYGIYISVGDKHGTYYKIDSVSSSADGILVINPQAYGTIYVFMINEQSCPNAAQTEIITSDTLDNIVPQPAPVVRMITVEDDIPVIYWEPSKNPEVTDYAIFSIENGYNIAIDTVKGRNSFYYKNPVHNASDSVAVYKIRSIEYCEDEEGLYSNITAAYNTVRLTHGEEDLCKRSIVLQWNGYNTITPVNGYHVEYSTDHGANFYIKDTLSDKVREYEFKGLTPEENTLIRISAILSNGEVSHSNIISFTSEGVAEAKNHFIRNITVADDHVEVEYVPDPAVEIDEIALERSTTGDIFSVLNSSVSIEKSTTEDIYILKDYSALTGRSALFYKVSVKNKCSDKFSSLPAKTILLKGKNLALDNELTWDFALIDENIIDEYRLIQIKDQNTSVIHTSGVEGTYTDKNIFTSDTFIDVCYYIEAEHARKDSITGIEYNLTSGSNTVCLHPTPQAFIPNAFAPNGRNRIFKPILVFASADDYNLKIFDRYGNKVFESNRPDVGWDGSHEGSDSPLDSYLYHMTFTGLNDVVYERNGFVILVK